MPVWNGIFELKIPHPNKPHQIIDRSIAEYSQGEVHGYDGIIFEIAMHDEIRVGQPHLVVMMDGVEELVRWLIRIPQSRIVPLLLQEKFHFVFLLKRGMSQHSCRRLVKLNHWNNLILIEISVLLTKLDSSGDAKLNNKTLTFTVNVPVHKKIVYFSTQFKFYLWYQQLTIDWWQKPLVVSVIWK